MIEQDNFQKHKKIARPEEKRAIITNLTLNNESRVRDHE